MHINFCGALLLVFITLKLTSVIAWSWWWVLSPIWLPWVAFLAAGILTFLISVIVAAFLDWKNKR